ncbi:hypothetical protein GCM10027037_05830 [Mucilaginibacter koreensis]
MADGITHHISDKRKAKLLIYEVEDLNEDIAMQEIATLRIGKSTISFDMPNATAMYLNASDRELKLAKSIYKNLIEPKLSTRTLYVLANDEITQIYDYFEHVKVAIIMAYTAVECLCNALIPPGYSYTEKGKDGERIWDVKEVQRWKSTTQKLRQILPNALKMKDPGQFKSYSTFSKLEDIRNEVIHTRNVAPKDIKTEDRIDYQLLQPRIFKLVDSARSLIKEMHAALPYNKEMPMLYETENVAKVKLKTWDDLGAVKTGERNGPTK